MRKIIKLAVLFALMYFVVGFILAKIGLLSFFSYQVYLEYSSVVGGTASVFGLLALGIPALTTKDLRELELESLKEVVNLAEDMKKADNELLKRSSEIDQLEQKKKRMELLMQKACMSIHLNDKYKTNTEKLIKIYRENKNIERNLAFLGEEIKQSGDKQLLKEIMSIVESKMASDKENIYNEKSIVESLNNSIYLKPSFFGIGFNLNALFNDLIKKRHKR